MACTHKNSYHTKISTDTNSLQVYHTVLGVDYLSVVLFIEVHVIVE